MIHRFHQKFELFGGKEGERRGEKDAFILPDSMLLKREKKISEHENQMSKQPLKQQQW